MNSADAGIVASCTASWVVEHDTAVGNGRVRHTATTVATCQFECVNTDQCSGFDWNPRIQPTGQCWLNGPWSGDTKREFTGVTHYSKTCDGTVYRT